MRKYRLKYSKQLRVCLYEQWLFLSNFDYHLSAKFLSNFQLAIKSLMYFPNRNQELDSNKKYRRMFFNNHYVIIYSVNEIQRTVYIQYLFSTKQNYNQFVS